MKKRLEADLISIAHRILQLKNKSDINQLYSETHKLLEKLTVLRFVEEYFEEPKPTIGQAEVIEKIDSFFENSTKKDTVVTDKITSAEIPNIENDTKINTAQGAITPPEPEKIPDEIPANESLDINILKFEPIFELETNDFIINTESIENAASIFEENEKTETIPMSFEDLLGENYTEPTFIKITSEEEPSQIDKAENSLPFDFQPPSTAHTAVFTQSITLNDKLGKGIAIGLNDRTAFVKHLFGGNNEDYNRVLNQVITFDSFQEAKDFIDEMVKPDYDNWAEKEDFEHRFMEIIEKKFLSF